MSGRDAVRFLSASAGVVVLCSAALAAAMDGETARAVTQPEQAPAAPTLGIAFGGRQLHLSWNAVSDATYYRIYQSPNGVGRFTQIGEPITGTSHDRDVAVERPNWSAERYVLEACNAVGCTAADEVGILDAILQAVGYFEASNTRPNDHLSLSLALSGHGNTVAVGVPDESSRATGVDGDRATSPDSASSGAVYIFTRRDSGWSQQAYLKASNTSAGDAFGIAVSLSGDGNTLAVGAYLEDSPGTGINGNQGSTADNNSNAGAVYVFTRRDRQWSQQAYLKAANTHANAYFGRAVSLANDGATLAAGATGENAGGLNAGAVYVFTRSAGVWSQQAYVKASNIQTNAAFGSSVSLTSHGNLLAVGAPGGSSCADETSANQPESIPGNAGAVCVFTRSASIWSQQPSVQASTIGTDEAAGAVASRFEDRP